MVLVTSDGCIAVVRLFIEKENNSWQDLNVPLIKKSGIDQASSPVSPLGKLGAGVVLSPFPPCSNLLYVKMVRVNECHGGLTRPISRASASCASAAGHEPAE